jgi:hypothetical protein
LIFILVRPLYFTGHDLFAILNWRLSFGRESSDLKAPALEPLVRLAGKPCSKGFAAPRTLQPKSPHIIKRLTGMLGH